MYLTHTTRLFLTLTRGVARLVRILKLRPFVLSDVYALARPVVLLLILRPKETHALLLWSQTTRRETNCITHNACIVHTTNKKPAINNRQRRGGVQKKYTAPERWVAGCDVTPCSCLAFSRRQWPGDVWWWWERNHDLVVVRVGDKEVLGRRVVVGANITTCWWLALARWQLSGDVW